MKASADWAAVVSRARPASWSREGSNLRRCTLPSKKLKFDDAETTVGYLDRYDPTQDTVHGWIASSREIESIELIPVRMAGVVPCEHGLPRPDVHKRHAGRYLATGTAGFRARLSDGGASVRVQVRFTDGGRVSSSPCELPRPGSGRADESYLHDDVPLSELTSHANWRKHLVQVANEEGNRVLEIGSRRVTGGPVMRELFDAAEYIGFDYHPGPNVDVVGDAHRLSRHVDGKFDLVFSTAVFEHLAMPWLVAEEIAKVLRVGGLVFVETHYAFSSHERPWHFFQFSEMALKVLFSPAMGFECIEAGVSNPIVGRFSELAQPYLRNRPVTGLYCHSGFYGRKVRDVPNFRWCPEMLEAVTSETQYPEPVVKSR